MSTNPLERIPKRSPKTSVTDLNEFAKIAGSTAASAAYPIMLGLTGEDTGDEWYEDLAYGAVPGGALVQRAMTGTKPGLLDLLPGELGAGAKLAMLPIAKFGAKEITKGVARMGKSGRNVAKAMEEKVGDSPYTFYHRTHVDNVDNIKKEGLNLKNSNYGRNTGDSDGLPPVNWLSPSPSAIPVLRYLLNSDPESVAQFKVTIPRDVYHNTPKFVMPEGRGSGRAVPVPKGELGFTSEGPYKILMYGDNIPPENLEQMSVKDVIEDVKDEDALEDFLNTIAEGYGLEDSYTLSRVLHENPQLEKRVDRVAYGDYGDIEVTGLDRPLVHELNSLTLPISERFVNGSKFIDNALDRANNRITRNAASKHPTDPELTPHLILQDELRKAQVQAGQADGGGIIRKKYWRPESKVSDLLVMRVAPMREPDIYETVPGPEKIKPGAVSRGLAEDTNPSLVNTVRQLQNRFDGGKVDKRSLKEAINNSANPTKTLEFLLNSENVGDVVKNMLTTTNYGHIGRVPYTADARRGGLQAMYKSTLPQIYRISYRESVDNGATDAEAREHALDVVKYWIEERSAEGASQGHISVGDLIEP